MTYAKFITMARRKKQGKESRAKRGSCRQEKPTHYEEPVFDDHEQTIVEMLAEERKMMAENEEISKEDKEEEADDEHEEYSYYYRHELLACGYTKVFPWSWPEQKKTWRWH